MGNLSKLQSPATSFFGLLWLLLCIPTLPRHHRSLGYLLSLWSPSPSFQVRVRMFSVKACCASGRGHPCQFFCFAAVPTGCYPALGESPCSEERIPFCSSAYIQLLQVSALQSVKFMYMEESLFPLLLSFYLQQATFLHWGRLDVPLGGYFSALLHWHQLSVYYSHVLGTGWVGADCSWAPRVTNPLCPPTYNLWRCI